MLADQMRIFPLPDEVQQYEQLIKQSQKSLAHYFALKSQIDRDPKLSGYRDYLMKQLDSKFNA